MKKRVNRCFLLFSVESNGLMSTITILLREILAPETFKYKPRTQQRSNLWNSIVDHLDDRDCSPASLRIPDAQTWVKHPNPVKLCSEDKTSKFSLA